VVSLGWKQTFTALPVTVGRADKRSLHCGLSNVGFRANEQLLLLSVALKVISSLDSNSKVVNV
jgi:hypothetical protein